MLKYTIHTENKNLRGIKDILNNHLGYVGYTLNECKGAWKGKAEKSLKIEVLADHDLNVPINSIAEQIRDRNKQDLVLVTVENVEAILL